MISQSIVFTANTGGASYSWTFQGGTPAVSTLQSPSVTWASAGTYNVALTVTQNGCQSTTSLQLTVTDCYNHNQTATFNYTGSQQTWTVPAGVCTITLECWGAEGGAGSSFYQYGGMGGYAKGTMSVMPGDVFYIYVGGKGTDNQNGAAGGWNGGGQAAHNYTACGAAGSPAGSGGGATDVRFGGNSLNERIIVAGGGGGGGNNTNVRAGEGGGLNGGSCTGPYGGYGASPSAGGAAGTYCYCDCASAGSFGLGGYGNANDVGGGGGGWYGGGGGGNNDGGGGGSGYTGSLTNPVLTPGIRTGHGQVIISY